MPNVTIRLGQADLDALTAEAVDRKVSRHALMVERLRQPTVQEQGRERLAKELAGLRREVQRLAGLMENRQVTTGGGVF